MPAIASTRKDDPRERLADEAVVAGPPSVLEGFLTPKALAAQLNVSVRTLQRLHRSRRGPPRCTIGKRALYRITSVRQWLAAQESAPFTTIRRAGRRA